MLIPLDVSLLSFTKLQSIIYKNNALMLVFDLLLSSMMSLCPDTVFSLSYMTFYGLITIYFIPFTILFRYRVHCRVHC